MGRRRLELVGQRFGRLEVIAPAGLDRSQHSLWLCRCDCGNETTVSSSNLGRTTSCGCYRDESSRDRHTKHGLWKTDRWWMYQSAQGRAKERGIPFAIKVTDIPEIPEFCPILGIKLVRGTGVGGHGPNSPTLDRIVPAKGYVPGNLQVISSRANVIKNDATAYELRLVAKYMTRLENSWSKNEASL